MVALLLLVIGVFIVGVGWGSVSITPSQIVGSLLGRLGVEHNISVSPMQESVLWAIRLPRVLMGLIAGCALGVSGVALQGVLRNPLAEPALLGVTNGAIVGVIAVIVSGLTAAGAGGSAALGLWAMPLAAFVGALIVTLVLNRMSGGARGQAPGDGTHFILTGVMMNLFLGAVIAIMTAMANAPGIRDTSFWTMGGLGGTLWHHVAIAAPITIAATIVLCFTGARLNLLALGETEARHLGVDTAALRRRVIVLVAAITGTAVAFAGSIAFVGLVVPHVLRLVIGPDHRWLLPAAALGGAVMVGGADVAARTLVAPIELPIGILTTLVGGPLFFYLLQRMRRRGGWR